MPDETYLHPTPSDMQSDELAEISGSSEHAPPSRQFCVFRAGRERFCLPVLEVEEVVDWPLVTRVPLGPPFLMGVFNLRGTIIPAVDIAVTEGRALHFCRLLLSASPYWPAMTTTKTCMSESPRTK